MKIFKHCRLNYVLAVNPDGSCELSYKSVLVSGQKYSHSYASITEAMDAWKLDFEDFFPE